VYQLGSGPWLPRVPPASELQIWAQTRLRVVDSSSKSTNFQLRRGNVTMPVAQDEDGCIAVTGVEELQPLNHGAAKQRKMLDIIITADAAGQVALSDLRVATAKEVM